MTVQALSAAKRLSERSQWTLSNLKLQKILYIAHMFYLGRTNGEPLVRGAFEAWDYGPVHPNVYHKVKIFGSDPVENIFHDVADMAKGPEKEILDEALESLDGFGPGQLVHVTHREGGAWEKNYIPGVRNCIISNKDILAEYNGLD